MPAVIRDAHARSIGARKGRRISRMISALSDRFMLVAFLARHRQAEYGE